MGDGTADDREGEGPGNIDDSAVDRVEHLEESKHSENRQLESLAYNDANTDDPIQTTSSSELFATHDVSGSDDMSESPKQVAAKLKATPIFQYRRSVMMDTLSSAVKLPSIDAIEIARTFDQSVAPFMPRAEEESEYLASKVNNSLGMTLSVAEKAIPSLQMATTFTSSAQSFSDSTDEENTLHNESLGEGGTRDCRLILCLTAVKLVGVIFTVLVVIFGIVKKHGIDNQESGSIFSGLPKVSTEKPIPTPKPTDSNEPTAAPSNESDQPSMSPSSLPTVTPSISPFALFNYGKALIANYDLGIEISEGLTARKIAQFGWRVKYANGSVSNLKFHAYPDGAGVASLPGGEWVYVSNSEDDDNNGGVYGLYFNKDGEVIDYRQLLSGTTWNCAGGMSPWNTWISCEETDDGQCWQIEPDPNSSYHKSPQKTLLGGESGGNYESVAVDNRNSAEPVFFTTEDNERGALRRYVADRTGWDALHVGGTTSYLQFLSGNRFRWTSDRTLGEVSASYYYPNTEGIAYRNSTLYFVSKKIKEMFILNLDEMTYTSEKTGSLFDGQGSFNAQPDQIIPNDIDKRRFIYFTEDSGYAPGIHARDAQGRYRTLFRGIPDGSYADDETVGIAFSPDRKRLYAGFQVRGVLFEITREDGSVFN